MRRREFITLLGGAAAVWPLAARAQQLAMPTIGFLSSRSADDSKFLVPAFLEGLKEIGFSEENIAIEYRWADGKYEKLPNLAADLVNRKVRAIATVGSSAFAAKSATATIPIVFVTGDDPVKGGLVSSLNRPNGNITGVTASASILVPKRLELIRELLPQARVIGFLVNSKGLNKKDDVAEAQAAARSLAMDLVVVTASDDIELERAFATLSERRVSALSVNLDPFFALERSKIIALAARHKIPTMYYFDYWSKDGGLISYGSNLSDVYKQGGVYVGKVLKGAKPSELPILQPTKFDLVINLKTAKTLSLSIPPSLLTRADDLIE
jgi:putative tryptophan/tyrosine transport system substrate-binding protein